MQRQPTRRRAAALTLGIFALVVVAAFGSRGLPGDEAGSPPVRLDLDPTRVIGVAMGLFAGITLLVLVWVLWPDGNRSDRLPRARQRTFGSLIMAAALMMGAVWLSRGADRGTPPAPTGSLVQPAQDVEPVAGPGWRLDAWMLVAVLGVSAAAVALLVRRGGATPAPVRTPHGPAGPRPDGRRRIYPAAAGNRAAVIRAYAGMEDTLESVHALPRRPWEAPEEYLARALPALGRRGVRARRLTTLYQTAHFSGHEIGDAMRLEADAALAHLRRPSPGEERP